jgi:ribosomal protein L2
MAVRQFKPTTPGQRGKVLSTFDEITASKPEKSLTFGYAKSGGRNNTGKDLRIRRSTKGLIMKDRDMGKADT